MFDIIFEYFFLFKIETRLDGVLSDLSINRFLIVGNQSSKKNKWPFWNSGIFPIDFFILGPVVVRVRTVER